MRLPSPCRAAQAYDVLKDTNKREIYDRFGHEGLQRTNGGGCATPPSKRAVSSPPLHTLPVCRRVLR